MAMLGLLLSATLLISPAARAFAGEQFRQIGALIFRQLDPDQALLEAEAASPVPTVPAPGDTTPPQQTSLLEDASRLAGFSVVAPGYLPEGYEVDTVWSIDRRESGIYVVSSFRDAAKQQFLLLNQIRYAPGASFEQTLGGNETLSDVEVRGTAGLWITGRLMTDPTDRSIPAVSMTKVMPMATMAMMDVCRAMFIKFEGVKNRSEPSVKTRPMINKMIKTL